MSFSRVNGSGWAVGDRFTSAQANQLDIDHANALDKSTANDTILGNVAIGSGAQISLPNATSAINITGNGAAVNASGNGSLIEVTGAGALFKTSGGGRLQHADNDYPTLAPGHAGTGRSITIPAQKFLAFKFTITATTSMNTMIPTTSAIVYNTTGVGSGSPSVQLPGVSASSGSPFALCMPLSSRLHQGATLASVQVCFSKGIASTAVPASGDMQACRVFRNTISSDQQAAGTADNPVNLGALGQYTPPGTVAAWNGSGTNLFRIVTATCTTNNVIDTSAFFYWLVFFDMCGANADVASNVYWVKLVYSNIADLRFP